MISVTGGFNQAYASGAPKIQKLKYAADTMSASDAAVAAIAIQHFRQFPADTLVISDAIASLLTYVPDIEHGYTDNLTLTDAAEAALAVFEE